MVDTSPGENEHKNPRRERTSPEEFKAHYERKLDRIEELSGECKRDGCTKTAEYPRDYCSTRCRNIGIQQAVEALKNLGGGDDS